MQFSLQATNYRLEYLNPDIEYSFKIKYKILYKGITQNGRKKAGTGRSS